MANSIRIRTSLDGDLAKVRCIIRHPMETGFRKDEETGEIIPFHFIKHVYCYHGDELIMHCDWSRAVSRNPYLSFQFSGASAGDTVRITWVDTHDVEESASVNLEA